MGDGSLSSRRRVSGHSVGEGVRAMGAVQAGFYYLFSLVSVESGPRGPSLSVYILHIPVDDTAFGTPRIRSDFRSGSDALLKPSTHSPDRLLTCASLEDFLSLAFFVLSHCTRVVRAWTLVVSFLDLAECYDWLSSKIREAYKDEQGRRRALVQREWSRARQSGWRQDVLSE